MERKEYNGWDNYETWLANLWLDSDYVQEEAERIYIESLSDNDQDTSKAYNDTVSSLADNIKDYVEESMPEVNGLFGDLLSGAMREINWREIAKHYVAEID